MSLSNSKVKRFVFSLQTDKEIRTGEGVVTRHFFLPFFLFLMNDKVDNSWCVLLNITFGMKWKSNGARQVLKQRLEKYMKARIDILIQSDGTRTEEMIHNAGT